MSNYGPKKPLNWKEPTFSKSIARPSSLDEKLDIHYRDGTPPTRAGASWGAPSGLSRPIPMEINPPLVLKAVLAPVKYGKEGKPQFARKRGSDGKFVEAETTGTQSTAQEDAERSERENKLAEHRSHDKLVDTKLRGQAVSRGESVKNPSVKDNKEKDGKMDKALGSQVPGVSSAMPIDTVNDPVSKQIGVTKTGNPIFDDPHHSEHTDFTPEDHQDAAQANSSGAQQAVAVGDQAGAMRMQNNASIHGSMANDTSNPSSRFINQLTTDNGQSPSMDDLPQDDLSSLMGGQPPMPSNTPAVPQQDALSTFMTGQPPSSPAGGNVGQPTPNAGVDSMPSPAMGQPPLQSPQPSVPPPNDASTQQSSQHDALSRFVDPGADQNKPYMNPPTTGPAPGMINNQTGTGVGQQTDASTFAGTAQQPQTPQNEMNPVSPDTSDTQGAVDLDQLFDGGGSGQAAQESAMDTSRQSPSDDSAPMDGGDKTSSNPFAKDSSDEDFQDDDKPEDKDKLKAAMNKALAALARLA